MTAMLTVLRSLARLPLMLLYRTVELPLPGLLLLMLRPLLLLPLRLLLLLLSAGLLMALFLLRWMLSLDLFKGRLLAYLREKGLSPRW